MEVAVISARLLQARVMAEFYAPEADSTMNGVAAL
jgi:hypothetical protein